MAIETLAQWNTRLTQCGCCPMPECPEPSILFEYKSGFTNACGTLMTVPGGSFSYPTPPLVDFKKYYKKKTIREEQNQFDFNGDLYSGYPETRTNTRTYSRELTGDCKTTSSEIGWISFSGTYTHTGTTYNAGVFRIGYDSRVGSGNPWGFEGFEESSYTDGLDEASTISEMAGVINAKIASDNWITGRSVSKMSQATKGVSSLYPGEVIINQLTLQKLRFRFKIPIIHTGTMFKITYDIAEFPTMGAASFVSEDNTVEWSGPGDPEEPDDWLTDWVEIAPPEVPGERRIVNIRFTCYTGAKFGVKPQVMGEAFELPEAP